MAILCKCQLAGLLGVVRPLRPDGASLARRAGCSLRLLGPRLPAPPAAHPNHDALRAAHLCGGGSGPDGRAG